MDNTPPRNRLIALYTAIAVATLLGLKPALDTYFDRMHISAVARGVERGFVETTVASAPDDEARRASERALQRASLSDCFDARLGAGQLEARVRNENGFVRAQLEAGGIEDQALRECVTSALQALSGMPSGEVQLRIAFAPTEAEFVKLGWKQALATAPTPIDQAMAQLARQGRLAAPTIRPRRTGPMNLDALRGWTKLPHEIPEIVQQAQQAQEPTPEGAPEDGAEGAAPEGAAEAGEPGSEEAAPAAEGAAAAPTPPQRPPAPEPEPTEE